MTLQIALLGKDGVLIASDTSKLETHDFTGYPEGEKIYTGKTHILGHDEKILLNKQRTVAVAWAGNQPSGEFLSLILEIFDLNWGKRDSSLNDQCLAVWKKEQSERRYEAIDCNLLFANCKKRQVYKASFSRGESPLSITMTGQSDMRYGETNGNVENPASFVIYRYLPEKLVAVDNLVRLVACYILEAGKINSYGVRGLRIQLSRDEKPFEAIPEDKILELMAESRRVDEIFTDFLLTPLSAVNSPNLEFLKPKIQP